MGTARGPSLTENIQNETSPSAGGKGAGTGGNEHKTMWATCREMGTTATHALSD